MATSSSWGHWVPSVICCFSFSPAADSMGLALQSFGRVKKVLPRPLALSRPEEHVFLVICLSPGPVLYCPHPQGR